MKHAMKFNAKKGDKVKMMMNGGKGPDDPKKAKKLKGEVLAALKGGASDKEIRKMIKDSGLQDKYEYNWDNVEMKVEMYKIPEKTPLPAGGFRKGMKGMKMNKMPGGGKMKMMPGGGKMKYAMYGSKMKK